MVSLPSSKILSFLSLSVYVLSLSLFIERMELNEELFADFMGKPELQELVSKWLGSQVYERMSGV
jgi:hypothetical protein